MSLTAPRPPFLSGNPRAAGLIGLFFLLFPVTAQANSLPPEDLLIQARIKLEANHYVEAKELVRRFLGDQPAHVEASFLLGVVLARQERWVEAGQALEHTIELNPGYVAAHVELAGVRHRQDARPEAMRHLRSALSLDPENTYARQFLASLAYLEDRQLEALHHWNAVGEPRIHEIRYLTPSQARPEFIGQLFRLNEGEVLTRERLLDIQWVRERLRLRTDFHWVLQPVSNDQWDLEISVAPKALSSWKMLLLENAPRIAFNQEVFAEFQNARGQTFAGGGRWDRHRKQVMGTSSFPFLFSSSDVLRLGGGARDETWRHTESSTDFALQTATITGSYEHCFRGRKSLAFHSAYRHQDFEFDQGTFPSQSPHVFALGLEWNQRVDLSAQDDRQLHWETRVDQINLLGEALRQGTYRLATGIRVNWSLRDKPRAGLIFSLRGGISGDLLPLDDYFSLGVGPDNPLPLRAHPTLVDSRKGDNPLGREFALANVEFGHQLFRWTFLEVDGLLFSDIAFVGRPPFGPSQGPWFHDVGAGLRLRAFGQDIAHFAFGWDLKTGSFNQWTGLPSRELGSPW